MAPHMKFSPQADVLTLEEIARLVTIFVSLGVTKVRLTGGEPLIRQNILSLIHCLGAMPKLKTLTLTSNGVMLVRYAAELIQAGVKAMNISLDTLNPQTFSRITRVGSLDDTLAGIEAARRAQIAVRLNVVILKGINDHEVLDLVDFARNTGCNIAFIEEMPLGDVGRERAASAIANTDLYQQIQTRFPLTTTDYSTTGPARYYQIADEPTQIGFISPHSQNFCSSCNRIRLTAEGQLILCLGNEQALDLRQYLRSGAEDAVIAEGIKRAMQHKPFSHHFNQTNTPQPLRFMNITGG